MALGFEQAGFETKFAFDYELDQAATFALNRPDTPVLRMDVKQIDFSKVLSVCGKPDVVIGGPPCQGFSAASKNLPDGNRQKQRKIYFEAIKAIGVVQPELFFIENSPNVARHYADPILKAMKRIGREAEFVVLAARDFGVPQTRRRAFLIDPSVESPEPSEKRITPRMVFEGLPKASANCSDELHRLRNARPAFLERIKQAKPGGMLYPNSKETGKTSSYTNMRIHPDKQTIAINALGEFCHFKEVRKLTFREYLRLQVVPDTYKFFASTPSKMRVLVARIMPPPFAKAWAENFSKALGKKKSELPDLTPKDWELVYNDFEMECSKMDNRVVSVVPDNKDSLFARALCDVSPKTLRNLPVDKLQSLNTHTHNFFNKYFVGTDRLLVGAIDREDIIRAQSLVIDEMRRCELEVTESELNKEVLSKAVWSRAYINDLPDSAFLYIAPGGKKDKDGKTVPRSLRYFPVYDSKGKLDLPHLRNALARIPQAKLPQDVKDAAAKKARKLLDEALKKAEDDDRDVTLLLVDKAEDDDRRIVFGVVLEPEKVDSQGDTIKASEIERAAHLWLARFQNRGLMHQQIVNSKIEIYESYIAPINLTIGKQKVKKGTWLLMYHVLDDELWKDIKGGKLTGFSMGGRARRVEEGS
jgi:DNA-cytosine methyltransferase